MLIESVLNKANLYLKMRGIENPGIDSAYLLSDVLKCAKNELILKKKTKNQNIPIIEVDMDDISERMESSVALILKKKAFFEDQFYVDRRTLIPRADTEHLLYAVQDLKLSPKRVIDIGTGSGALAVSVHRICPGSFIDALDINISVAKKNIESFGIEQIQLIKADFLRWNDPHGIFYDLIISNPPYLSVEDFKLLEAESAVYEPRRAFYGGKNGLIFYQKIAEFAALWLNQDGWIILEVDHKWKSVAEIFNCSGFTSFEVRKDYAGKERVVLIRGKGVSDG